MIKIEKKLITNLKPNEIIGLPIQSAEVQELAIITKVSEPRKAGKHGAAKVFYNYTKLLNDNKVQAVGKSRDEITVMVIVKKQGEKIFEENNEIGFLSPEGDYLLSKKDFFINITEFEKKEVSNVFYYFIFNDYIYYHNK